MKKFILPAIAVLGITTLSSCQEELQSIEDVRNENYTRAFVREFGVMDPTHDWGFRSTPITDAPASRADGDDNTGNNWENQVIDVNAEKWKNPPLIKEWERVEVLKFLHENPGRAYGVTLNLDKPYFMTNVGNCCEIVNANPGKFTDAEKHEFVQAVDQSQAAFKSGSVMNNLHVALNPGADLDRDWNGIGITAENPAHQDFWDHVNNFNKAENNNYFGNTVVSGKGHGGSYDFMYENSRDSKHYNNYIIIPGSLIDFRLSAYHYLCFDFEAYKTAQTKLDVEWKDNNDATQSRGDLSVSGYYENGAGITDEMVIAALEANGVTGVKEITKKTFRGYANADKLIPADGIYDDWIIRICGDAVLAHDDRVPVYPHEDYEAYRIFVEDLAALSNHDYTASTSDWDFNDVVFDVKYSFETKKVQVVLRALGGTYPAYLCGVDGQHVSDELHSYFGVPVTTMVNTGIGTDYDVKVLEFDADLFGIDANNKETVKVKPGEKEIDVTRLLPAEFNKIRVFVDVKGTPQEMLADEGQAPSKLCVPSYLAAPLERVHITGPYPKFREYVADKGTKFWESAIGGLTDK